MAVIVIAVFCLFAVVLDDCCRTLGTLLGLRSCSPSLFVVGYVLVRS